MSDQPTRAERGRTGEKHAAELLRARGYRIIEANVRFRGGEIDLVADDRGTLVFVEVRARQPGIYGSAAESITLRKQQRVRRAVAMYLARHEVAPARPIRIDAVTIELDLAGRVIRSELIQDAFGGD